MADLRNFKTKRGAVMSVHGLNSSFVTTNVHESGWLVVTDPTVIQLLGILVTDDRLGQLFEAQKIIDSINQMSISVIGYPYRRGARPTSSSSTSTSTFTSTSTSDNVETNQSEDPTFKYETCQKLLNFFSEFNFVAGARFTSMIINQKNYTNACKYIKRYFQLCDHPDCMSIVEKIKSDEFKLLINDLLTLKTPIVNKRLEILYGPAGTGKTTQAINNYPNAKVITCHASMEPMDLLKTFKFDNGKTTFEKSELRLAMENGEAIILDEINLLRPECLKLIQELTDNKTKISFENEDIEIKQGFKIIGTMNLIVNGQVFFLPEALVDRAYKLEDYEISGQDLARMLFNC